MGNNEVMITGGIDLEDAKAILLHRKEVVSIDEYLVARDSIFELQTLILLAVKGDEKAIAHFSDNAEENFDKGIPDGIKEDVLIHIKNILDRQYPDTE